LLGTLNMALVGKRPKLSYFRKSTYAMNIVEYILISLDFATDWWSSLKTKCGEFQHIEWLTPGCQSFLGKVSLGLPQACCGVHEEQ